MSHTHGSRRHCIVPPHMLRAMAESKDRRIREAALRTLLTSTRLRGQREVIAGMRSAVVSGATGDRVISVHDAGRRFLSDFELPGPVVQPPYSGAAKEAHDGLAATYDFFSDVYGRNSIDDRGLHLVGTVHFGVDYNNAFWNGRQMVFGDGDGVAFVGFTGALDVIAHELTHGVTEFTAGLEYHKQPGALNESFSDVFGALVKQYVLKQDARSADWLIGAGILGPNINGVALRSMKDPGSAYDDPAMGGKDPQPKRMADYLNLPDDEWNDWGGVHINSGIPNHAFYLVATQLGGNAWEDAGEIWYNALQQLWQTSQFEDCANVTTQVAGSIFGTGSAQQEAVKAAWETVGVRITAPQPAARKRRQANGGAEMNGSRLRKQLERLGAEIEKTIEALP